MEVSVGFRCSALGGVGADWAAALSGRFNGQRHVGHVEHFACHWERHVEWKACWQVVRETGALEKSSRQIGHSESSSRGEVQRANWGGGTVDVVVVDVSSSSVVAG